MKKASTNFLPVVQRELREGARRPFNYWLRVGGATAGVLLLYDILKSAGADQAAEGLQLFTSLHQMMLVLICLIVPAMSADCIAREKREGTLGLLFLTPLTAMGIVAGKSLVQIFRAFTLWVAVLPVLIIPFLLGGVTGGDIYSAFIMEFCMTLLCLAAGIMASSLAKARTTAFILAAGFMVCFTCLFGGLLGLGCLWQTNGTGQPVGLTQVMRLGRSLITGQLDGNLNFAAPRRPLRVMSLSGGVTLHLLPNGSQFITWPSMPGRQVSIPSSNGWGGYFSTPANRSVWEALLLQSLLAIPLLFYLVLRIAASLMARFWQERGPSPRRESWIKTYCLPLARRRFARRLNRTLDRNPIVWLQQYSWKARASKWGICLLFVALECALTAGGPSEILQAQSTILMILAAVFSFVAVSGFLTEKRNGALELLLVTPISPNQLIFGRVWGLWLQFLPTGLTLLLFWLGAEYLVIMGVWVISKPQNSGLVWSYLKQAGDFIDRLGWPHNSGPLWSLLTSRLNWKYGGHVEHAWVDLTAIGSPGFKMFVAVIGFFTLPVFASCFALRVKNLFVAAALTWLALLLCPYFALMALGALSIFCNTRLIPPVLYAVVFLTNLAFALLACFLLRHSLSRRIYSF